MIPGPLTEKELREYLSSMGWLGGWLGQRRLELRGELAGMEDCICVTACGNSGIAEEPIFGGDYVPDVGYRVLGHSYRDRGDPGQAEELARKLRQVAREEEMYYNMKECIRCLPLPQAELLQAIYIDGVGWEEYARRNYISKTTVYRYRKRAVQNLLALYNRRFDRSGAGASG